MLSGIGDAAPICPNTGFRSWPIAPASGRTCKTTLKSICNIRRPATDNPVYKYWNLWGKALIGAQWLLTKRGLGASNQFEACGFIRSKAGVEYPDIQYHFLPIAVRYDGKASAAGHGFQVHTGPMRSKSRGSVTLRSSDPRSVPKIQFNYMSHPSDWEDFRSAIRLTREVFDQPAMRAHVRAELQPGAGLQSDADLDSFQRDHAESAYHPCGTARMGRRDDLMAVVDPGLSGDRGGRSARGRQFDFSTGDEWQPERPVDHDRRKGRRSHIGAQTAAVQSGTAHQPELAQRAAVGRGSGDWRVRHALRACQPVPEIGKHGVKAALDLCLAHRQD